MLGLDLVRDSLAIRRRIGFLSGDVALYPNLRVAEYLRFLGSFSAGYDFRAAEGYAKRLGLDVRHRIRGLSKGNRQKVGLVGALQHRPDLLVLDEPTTGLDPLLQQEMHDVLREERKRGVTVFLSSHDLKEVQDLCDRAAILRDGVLVKTVDVNALRNVRARRYEVTYPSGRVEERQVTNNITGFLRDIAQAGAVDLREREVTVEDTFLALYQEGAT